MLTIFFVAVGIFNVVWGARSFFRAAFRWEEYSQHPEQFPLAKRHIWQIDSYGLLYETYGEKAVRKSVLFWSAVIVVIGILLTAAILKDNADWGRIEDYPQAWQGDAISFAGGTLTIEDVGVSEGFTAKRFNVDKNRYEEVEVKADMYGEGLLLIKTTLTNNSKDTLRIVHEDLKFYAKPAEEGHNINGRSSVDGYLYHSDDIELAVGESVPVWFWMSLTEEEWGQFFSYVLQYGKTGCVLLPE